MKRLVVISTISIAMAVLAFGGAGRRQDAAAPPELVSLIETEPGEIDRLILLAHSPIDKPEQMKGRKLFILTREDFSGDNKMPRLPKIRNQYERAPGTEGVGNPRRLCPRSGYFRDGRRRTANARDSAIPFRAINK